MTRTCSAAATHHAYAAPRKGIALALSFLFAFALQAGTFYVGTGGSSGASGSLADPFFLVQEAIDQCVSGSDTVLLLPGTYWQQFGIYDRNGIWLGSADPADPATISGSGLTGLYQIVVSNSSNITIAGLVLREHFVQEAKAIYALGEGDGLYIIDNEIYDVGWGNDPMDDPEAYTPVRQAHAILVNGRGAAAYRNVYIGRNHIHDVVVGNSEALTLAGNVRDFLIEDNRIERCTNIGIDVSGHYTWAYPDSLDQANNQSNNGRVRANTVSACRRPTPGNEPAAIYVDGGANIYVDQNTVFDNGTGISLGCENPGKTASAVVVANNWIYNNDKFGTVFGANAGDVVNGFLRNNSYYNNGIFFDNAGSIALQSSTTSIVRNNIVYRSSDEVFGISLFAYAVTDLQVDHNLFYNPDSNTTRAMAYIPVLGSSAVIEDPIRFADPLWVDTARANPDPHLLEGSPAIDAGSADVLLLPDEVDLDGDAREAFNIDMGVDEFVVPDTTSAFGQAVAADLRLYPNPTGGSLVVQAPDRPWEAVVVYAANGREVFRRQAKGGLTEVLALEGLPSGRYVLAFRMAGTAGASWERHIVVLQR